MKAQSVTVTVADLNSTVSDRAPVNYWFNYSYSQAIYLSTELQPGMITAISYQYDGSTPVSDPASQIYMAEIATSSFTTEGDWIAGSALTQVFSGTVSYSQGWVTINLNTPFIYNGTGNLLVAYLSNGSRAISTSEFKQMVTTDNRLLTYSNDSFSASIAYAPDEYDTYMEMYVPNTKFEITPFGTDYCYPPTNLAVSNITTNGAEITWENNENVTTFAVEYKLATEEDWTLASNSVSGNTYTLSGLETYTSYEVKVYGVCTENSQDVRTSFTTLPDASLMLSIPYEQDFDNIPEEGLEKWFFQNGGTNAWHLGTAANNTRDESGELTENGGAMYISNDNGVSNNYSGTSSCYYAYTFVTFEEESTYGLQFDWRCMGETSIYDYARVYLLPIDATLSPTSMPAVANAVTEVLNGSASWQTVGMEIPQSYSGNTWKLVFA